MGRLTPHLPFHGGYAIMETILHYLVLLFFLFLLKYTRRYWFLVYKSNPYKIAVRVFKPGPGGNRTRVQEYLLSSTSILTASLFKIIKDA